MRSWIVVGLVACVAAMGCGGTVEPVTTDDAGPVDDVAAPDAAADAPTAACMFLWCGDQWLPCDETGHAVCKNRKAVCQFDPAAPACD